MKKFTQLFSKQFLGFITGGIGGYVLGALYFYIFDTLGVKIGLLSIKAGFKVSVISTLLLKDKFVYFPQLISTLLGLFIGFYFIKNKKMAIVLLALLILFYILFFVGNYVFWSMVGPLFG